MASDLVTAAPARIAVVGDHDRSLVTHRELDAALTQLPDGVEAAWCASTHEREIIGGAWDGVWIAPGTPYRDDGAVLDLIDDARRSGLPLLGTCGGFQYAALVLARELAGI